MSFTCVRQFGSLVAIVKSESAAKPSQVRSWIEEVFLPPKIVGVSVAAVFSLKGAELNSSGWWIVE